VLVAALWYLEAEHGLACQPPWHAHVSSLAVARVVYIRGEVHKSGSSTTADRVCLAMRRPLLCPLVVITVWTVCDILATQAVGVCDSIQWQIGVEHGASWTQQVGSLPSTVAELTSSLHRAPVAWEQARVTSTWLVLFPTPALRVWVVLPQASPRTELVVAVNVTSDAPELLSVTLASWTHGKLVPQAQWVQHGSTHVVGADVERQAGDPAGSAVPDSEGLNDVVRLVEDCDARHTVASHVDRIVQRHPGWAPASLLSEALKQGTVTVSTDRIARLIEAHPSASLRFRLPSSLHAVVTKPTHTAVETRSHGLRSPATTAAPTVAAGTAHAAVASTVAVVVMHTTPPSAELLAAVAQQSHRPSTTVFVGGRTVLSQDGQAFTAPPALEAALSEGVRCGDTYIAVLAPSVQPDMAWLSTALSVLQGPNNAGIAVMAGKKMTIGDDGVVNGWTSPKTPDERLPSSQARSPGHIHALVDVGLSAWVVSRPVALEFLSQVAVFRSQHPAQFHVPPWHSLDAVGPVALSAVASLAFQLHTVDIGARGGVSTVAHGVLDAQLAEHVEWWRSQRGWRLLQHSNEGVSDCDGTQSVCVPRQWLYKGPPSCCTCFLCVVVIVGAGPWCSLLTPSLDSPDAHVGAGFHPTTLESMPRPVVVSSAQTQRLCAPGELPLTRGCLQRGQVTVVLTVYVNCVALGTHVWVVCVCVCVCAVGCVAWGALL